ncbi:ATP-binding protein [Planotetraspora sp. GP83]|uniref:ATP-binding protein n=1 Tax=Planotetraspora sp. GP83 TaxID=3156264 RepID=UPI00351368F8
MGELATWPVSDDLGRLRELVDGSARWAGLSDRQREDLVLAASEAATNVLEHARGRGQVRIWADEEFLSVDIFDDVGQLAPDAFPQQRPVPGRNGLGLWVMDQVCDEATITRLDGRSRVRLRMRRAMRSARALLATALWSPRRGRR